MKVEIAINGRFRELKDVEVTPMSSNAWQLRIPLTVQLRKWVRGRLPEALDGAVLALDEQECEPAVLSGDKGGDAILSVYLL